MRDGATPPSGQPRRPCRHGRNDHPADPGTNPLRRPCDRARARWHLALALAVLIALICGGIAGTRLWNDAERAARDAARHRHETTATTLARPIGTPTTASSGTPSTLADASWRAPDGTPRTGKVAVEPRTAEGATVRIWVDDAGAVARAPRGTAEGRFAAVAGGTLVAGTLSLAAAGAVGLRLRRTETRSLDEWESEWAVVEPLWTHRGHTEPGPEL